MDKDMLATCGLSSTEAERVWMAIMSLKEFPPLLRWQEISRKVLRPEMPFALHQYLHEWAFADWDESISPVPAWTPDPSQVAKSNIGQMMSEMNFERYEDFYSWSIEHSQEFYETMIQRLGIVFEREPITSLNLERGIEEPQWFYGGKLNIAKSCFQAPPDAKAIVYEKDDGTLAELSYMELQQKVAQVANALKKHKIKPRERVAVIMPMTVEAVAIYLGIIAMGCSAVTIADSFSVKEMRVRLDLASAICVFTQDYYVRGGKSLPLYERVIEAAKAPAIVILTKENCSCPLRSKDIYWHNFISGNTEFEFDSDDPQKEITLLFSSGTTGKPKAIPWNHCTAIKGANDAHLHHDIHADDVLCWPTNLGWMMGPWLVFAALLNKATIALSNAVPTTREFAKFVADSRVTMLGLVPSIVNAWQNSDCVRGLDWSSIRAFSSTGECSNAQAMFYLMSLAGYKPVIEYCGGTEVGGGYITGTVVQPCVPGMFSTPALGSRWFLLDEQGESTTSGEVFFKPPTLGLSTYLLYANHHNIYYEGTPIGPSGELLRRHGDYIEQFSGGYYRSHGRVDDTMNLGGIKVSNVQIEEVLSQEEGVVELAAVAVSQSGGGPSRLVIYVCSDAKIDAESLKMRFQKRIRSEVNPLFKVFDVVGIDDLPRTASNKVMRRKLRVAYERMEEENRSE